MLTSVHRINHGICINAVTAFNFTASVLSVTFCPNTMQVYSEISGIYQRRMAGWPFSGLMIILGYDMDFIIEFNHYLGVREGFLTVQSSRRNGAQEIYRSPWTPEETQIVDPLYWRVQGDYWRDRGHDHWASTLNNIGAFVERLKGNRLFVSMEGETRQSQHGFDVTTNPWIQPVSQ